MELRWMRGKKIEAEGIGNEKNIGGSVVTCMETWSSPYRTRQ